MKLGIFGGTFDPPHKGHINMCRSFLNELKLNKLYVIPTNIPPHKKILSNSTNEQRFKMSELAFSDISEDIVVSDLEMNREGKSYTADTIKHFISEGYNDIYFLCGTDMILTLGEWYNPKYIFENATVVYARRENDFDNEALIKEKIDFYEKNYGAKIIKLEVELIEISSSQIRESILYSKNEFLSEKVYNYIKANNLYNASSYDK